MIKVRKKFSKKTFIALFTIITMLILACVFLAASIIENNRYRTFTSDVTKHTDVYDENYYQALLDDKINLNDLKLIKNEDGENTYTLIGFIQASQQLSDFFKTLDLSQYNTADHIITRIAMSNADIEANKTAGNLDQTNYEFTKTVREYIRALIIPNTVIEITEESLFGFGSLEYLSTPFIGTERGSSAAGLKSGVTATSKPLVTMFSTSNDSTFIGHTADEEGNLTSETYPSSIAYWYEEDQPLQKPYTVPAKFTRLVVTDETSLGNHALFNINSLISIDITASPTTDSFNIGTYCFADNLNLQYVVLPQYDVSFYGNSHFNHDPQLKNVELPYQITSIPKGMFQSDENLRTVIIPDTIKDIGELSFSGCSQLRYLLRKSTSGKIISTYSGSNLITCEKNGYDIIVNAGTLTDKLDLPSNLTSIARQSFKGCIQLTSIVVPNSVEYIGYEAFNQCGSLHTISLPFVGGHRGTTEHNSEISGCDGKGTCNLFGHIFGETSNPAYDVQITQKVNYPSTDPSASEEDKNPAGGTYAIPKLLRTVYITNDTEIAVNAFQNCYILTTINISDTVTKINEGALNGCTGLVNLTIPFMGVTATGKQHFGTIFGTNPTGGAIDLASGYYVPVSLTTIRVQNQDTIYSNQLASLRKIETVEISDETNTIQEAVFYDNPSLTTLYVPFVGVQRGIFYQYNWWWRDIQWRNTLQWMFSSVKHLDNTYENRNLVFGDSYIKYIPKSLENVYITSETKINYYGLRNFCSIKNLHIYSGNTNKAGTKFELQYMEDSFLAGCSSLETLDVPYIGYDINNKTISSAKYTLGHFFGYYGFNDEYSKAKTRTQYKVNNFSTHYIPSTLTGVTVTSPAAKITADMFKDCKSLLSVNFTDADIQSLGDYAFYGCTGLNTVLTPKASYTAVGDYAFYKCINIHNINAVIPDTVKIIGNYAFAGSSVGDNTNPIDLTRFNEIGNYAFYNCMKINQINITNNITRLGEGVFQDCQYLTDVTLTKKLVSKNLFKNCYSLKKIDLRGITVIPDGLFDGDYNLLYDTKFSDDIVNGLIIDKETTTIGKRAFFNCSSLQQFDIFSSLDKIDEYAFSGCTGLEKMHMLKEVSTINAHAWDDCDPNFYFTVDIATEDWPTGWTTNWNCGYPVYAPNDMTDQIFVYEYNYYHQGYIIVGIQEDVTLSGIVRIPSSHDGLPVWGVSNLGILNDNGTPENTTDDYWENKISGQSGITAVIIPKSVYYLDSMVFNNGNRVDLYFEETRANVQSLFNQEVIVDGKRKSWEPFKAEDSFIEGGLVFYGENWQYGPFTSASQVPYVKVSSLVFNYSFKTTVYNGYEIKADEITEILLPGYAVTSQDLGITSKSLSLNDKTFIKENVDITQYNYFGFDPTTMFNYSYTNNIEAGQARVTASLNNEYKNYLAALEEFGENLVYLTGSRTQTFTIQKAQIDVYMDSSNVEYAGSGESAEMIMTPTTYTTRITTVYDEHEWYNTNWNGLVDGLQYFNATFQAKISTRGYKAGIYRFNSFQDGDFVPFTNGSGAFVFDYIYIRRSGADITRNFNIYLYLEVEILKRDVMFDWTDATYDQNNQCYQTYYNGSTPALPGAKAIDYLAFKEDPTVRNEVKYCEVKVATSGVSTLIPSASKYQAYAYLRDSNNFRLVDELGNPMSDNPVIIDGVQRTEYKKTDFIIGKGKIEIEIQAKRVISPTETCWSYDFRHTQASAANLYKNRTADNIFKITGIGTDTIFSGRLVTTHDKNTIYEWDSQTQYKVIWEETLREGSTTLIADYHLYRKEDNGDGFDYIPEDNYYDVIVKSITVVVEYADMTDYVDYYVSYADGSNEKKLSITETNNISASGRNLVIADTNVNGNEYKIYVKIKPESGLTGIHYPAINYFHEESDQASSIPMPFKEPDREYSVGIFVEGSSHHFIDYNRSLLLNTHKSNVTFMDEPLTKVYDRLQLDLIKDKIITDISAEQVEYMNSTPECLNFYNYNNQVNPLPTPPVEVGTYRFKLYLPETAYYKGVGQSLEAPQSFIISIDRREIIIDLTGETTLFTDEDFSKNSRKYNGSPQKFTPDSDKLIEQGYLLGEDVDLGLTKDEFVGYFETAGSTPAIYEPDDILKYWSVVNSTTGVNVSKNYKVTLINSYEIKNLEFAITEHDYIAEYDGSYHITYVSVGTENVGDSYTIYYSKDDMFNGEYKDIKWNKAITTPFGRSTPTDEPLTYYYAVVGENYTMAKGELTIDIKYLTIKKNDPAKEIIEAEPGTDSILDDEMTYVVGYTGEYQYYIVTVDEPWYATVYYSLDKVNWTTEPYSVRECNDDNPLRIYYKIEAEYYNTDYSRRELVDSLAHEPVLFIVTENMYPSLSSDDYSVPNKEYEYDGEKHGLVVTVTPPNNEDYIIHYSLDGIDWTLSPIEYTETGVYEIYVRISVKGYKTIIIPKVKLTITKLTFEGISVENTTAVYDGKYHTVKINGLTYENGIYYYGTGDDKIPVQVLSTTSENVYNAGKGYQFLQSFKDVSIAPYKLWVLIRADNYNDLLLATGNGEGLVTITKATADDIIFEYTEKNLQYTGVDFNINDLGIVTNHDKKPIIKIYAVNYDAIANKNWVDTDILVSNPIELGQYAFTIQYPDSLNCAQLTKGADPDFLYFSIVQRVVDVEYLDVMTYTGKELTPIINIISHTKDEFGYNYDPINGTPNTMFEVGEYQYKITLNPQNPNYILNPDCEIITIKVEKIHLDLDFPLYQKPYDGEIFMKTGKNVTWNGDVNLESLIPGHIFDCTITSQYAYKNDYYYSESPYASNLANVEWDIYVYGSNNEKISVKDEFYTYNVSAHIKITNPIIDTSKIQPTEVYFDGYPHTITIMDKLSALMAGATVTFREDASQPYMNNPISKTYAFTYNIGFKITKSGWESYEGVTQLKILTSDLAIMIDDISTEADYQIYDGTEKQITYSVAVKNGDSTIQLNPEFYDNFIINPDSIKSPGEVRYYKTTNVSLGELNSLYSSFDPLTSVNTNVYKKGASAMVDAGKYYAVVCYYAVTGQWNVSYAIKEVEIEQRPISIDVPDGVQIEKVYDKKPISFGLGNANIDKTNLIVGHDIDLSKKSSYSVKTNSANANSDNEDDGNYYYNPLNGFVFEYMKITNFDGKDVTSNYRPVLGTNVKVRITRAYLKPSDFIVQGLTRSYDGTIAAPTVKTPSDGALSYIFKNEAGVIYVDSDGKPVDQKEVGTYYVTVSIATGTNYYGSDFTVDLPQQEVEVIITPALVTVDWEKTSLQFNGDLQAPTASIKTFEKNVVGLGITQDLEVYFLDDENGVDVESYAKVAAGKYIAFARFSTESFDAEETAYYEKNYALVGDYSYFLITSKAYNIILGNAENGYKITDMTEGQTEWITHIDATNIENFPSTLSIKSKIEATEGVAQLRTTSGKPGIYNETSQFDTSDIRVYMGNEEVTESISFNIFGSVVLQSKAIYVTPIDKELVYIPQGHHLVDNQLFIIENLPANRVNVSFDVNGVHQVNSDYIFTNVGVYDVKFYFTDTQGTFDNASLDVTVEIVQATSTLVFDEAINNFTYNGSPISVSVNSTSFNGGSYSTLEYEFYAVNDDETTTYVGNKNNPPIDAGNYIVKVTNSADYDSNIVKNYTVLDETKAFTIKPRKVTVKQNLDVTLNEEQTSVNYTSAESKMKATGGMVGADEITYSIKSANNVNLGLTTYRYSGLFYFANTRIPGNPVVPAQDKEFTVRGENGLDYNFILRYQVIDMQENNYRTECDGVTRADISQNYYVDYELTLSIHYQNITGYTVAGYTGVFDGLDHHGSVTENDPNVPVIQKFAFSSQALNQEVDNVSVFGSIDNAKLTYNKPGEYKIFYKLSAVTGLYEPLVGSVTIAISKVERENLVIDSLASKTYDGTPMYSKWINNCNYYLPHYTFTKKTVNGITLDDNIEAYGDKIKITYYIPGSTATVDPEIGCIDAASYTYSLILPETDYYLASVVTNSSFTIAPKTILVKDKEVSYVTNYAKGEIAYVNNISNNSESYYVVSFADGSLIPDNMEITGIFQTTSGAAGTYLGSNGSGNADYGLKWFSNPIVKIGDLVVTGNYSVSLANASITISKGKMNYSIVTNETIYKSQVTYSVEPSGMDYWIVEAYYNGVTTFSINPQYHLSLITPSSYTSFSYSETGADNTWGPNGAMFSQLGVGQKTFYIRITANNYETVIAKVTIKVKATQATLALRPGTGFGVIDDKGNDIFEYTGNQVGLLQYDSDFITNNNELNGISDYTFTFYKYDELGEPIYFSEHKYINNDWKVNPTCQYATPRNIGKYSVTVTQAETENFSQAILVHDFEIVQTSIGAAWSEDSFTYNGLSQSPTPTIELYTSDANIAVPLTVKLYSLSDVNIPLSETINAGTYRAVVSIDVNNSSLTSDEKDSLANYNIIQSYSIHQYTITKRDLKISLNASTNYSYNKYYKFYQQGSNLGDGTFAAQGIVNDIENGVIHTVQGYLQTTDYINKTYTKIGTDLVWINDYSNTGTTKIKVLDNTSKSVESNYNVSYELKAKVDFTETMTSVIPFSGVYDGKPHSIQVTINNTSPEDYTIEYSLNGTDFTTVNYEFTDVKSDGTAYIVYYRAYKTSDGEEGKAQASIQNSYVAITKKNAELSFVEAFPALEKGKIYDGIPVEDPLVICLDSTAKYTYTYYKNYVSAANYVGSNTYKQVQTLNKINQELVSSNGIIPVDVGKYILVVKLATDSPNYQTAEKQIEFEITKRTVLLTINSNKIYNQVAWSKTINENDFDNLPIVSGHKFTGLLMTKSVNVGTYDQISQFYWSNGFSIKDSGNNNVSSNYELIYQLNVEITLAPMSAIVIPYEGTWDGKEHGLAKIELTPTIKDGFEYPVPISYKIEYKDESLDEWTTEPITKSEVGYYPIAIRIKANNYIDLYIVNTEEYKSYIKINGLKLNDPEFANNFQYEHPYQYTGTPYPIPEYINCPSDGEQEVIFYDYSYYETVMNTKFTQDTYLTYESEHLSHKLAGSPKDVGNYVFVLKINKSGRYDEMVFIQVFTIDKCDVEVIWENLTLEYTGFKLNPLASYQQVEADGGAFIMASLSTNAFQTLVGVYDNVIATTEDTNYNLLNNVETFEITKMIVERPLIREDLSFEYHSPIVITDTSDNTFTFNEDGRIIKITNSLGQVTYKYEYELDSKDKPIYDTAVAYKSIDGETFETTSAFPYTVTIDSDMNVGTHQIVVSLDKIQTIDGYDTNYMWDTQSSDDLIFTFEITTWKFPNANNQLKFVYNDTHFYTGEEIKPELTVSVVDSLTQEELYQLVLDKDFEVAYANNISVTKKDSKAEIIVTFIGNFESEDNTLYFNILATEPTLLTIKEGKKVQFINAQYTDTGVTIYEDDTAIERTEDNKDNGFYLGHMVDMIPGSAFLDYFANDKNKLLLFGKGVEYLKKENALQGDDLSSNVGTGFTVVLYTDETHDIIADHIQVIIYGDIDGNGNINANDSLDALKFGGGSMVAKSGSANAQPGATIVEDIYYFAGMIIKDNKYYINANDSLKILNNNTTKINADYYE